MAAILKPSTPDEVAQAVTQAMQAGTRLSLRGGGSKADFGAPLADDVNVLDMTGFASVIDYDPAELVLTAGAGTRLSEIEALVASEDQMLAFEPFDHGPIYGRPAGAATLGGVVAAGVSGSRRISAGAARDHLLGFKGVSGRGEAFVAGAKVVKNVTGYDLPKAAAGSWGRLAALTEITVKVLPRGREQATLLAEGLDPAAAQRLMARAMGSQAELSAAAHLPNLHGRSLTALRIEGFGPSVAARVRMLIELAAAADRRLFAASPAEAADLWGALGALSPLAGAAPLWRINVPPSGGPTVVEALAPLGARWLFDWAGGLVWLTLPGEGNDGDAAAVRAAAVQAGGHATLVRGPAQLRASVPAFHPQAPGVAALEARVRRAFDPIGVFETGRFGEPRDAH